MLNGKKEAYKPELLKQIDANVLEEAYGGLDSRPFNSSLYLGGPFSNEYKTILDETEITENKPIKEALISEVSLIIPSDK